MLCVYNIIMQDLNHAASRSVPSNRWYPPLADWTRPWLTGIKDVVPTISSQPCTFYWYCFRSISLFICLFISFFVSLLARLRENGRTDLHEIFTEGAEWPWDNVIQFWSKSVKPCDDAMLKLIVVLWPSCAAIWRLIMFYFFVSKIVIKRLDRFT